MPTELVPRKFDAACLPSLSAFSCGQGTFEKIATDWICCQENDNALAAIKNRGTEVFLYFTPGNDLVGFGSLGKTLRMVKKVQEEWSIIPHVGIAKVFHGHPPGSKWQDRYAASIMTDLMALARDHNTPTLMLKVHKDNEPAKKLYGRLGFCNLCGPNQDGYLTMTIQNHD